MSTFDKYKVPEAGTGTFTASGQSTPVAMRGKFNVLIDGGVATTTIERSFDNGSTWYEVSKDIDGTVASYTTNSDLGLNGVIDEPEGNIEYRLNCAWTSGTVTYRLSQ